MPFKQKLPQYPVFLDLRRRAAIVIGGGEVAERKVKALVAAGAKVRVIAKEATPGLQKLGKAGKIRLRLRAYRIGDLMGYPLVIAATDDPKANVMVHDEVQIRGGWVNVVDDPDLCTFYAPAVVTRGHLSIAVATAGTSPTLAKRIREDLEKRYGPEYEGLLDLFESLRPLVRKRFPKDQKKRARAFAALTDAGLLKYFKAGKPAEARKAALNILDRIK